MSADGAAVLQVVLELVGFGQRVDDRDHGVGLEHRPERHHGVDGVVAEHDDAIAARDAVLDQRLRQGVGAPIELAVGEALLVGDESDLVRQAARGVFEIVLQLRDGTVHVGHGVSFCSRADGPARARVDGGRRKS